MLKLDLSVDIDASSDALLFNRRKDVDIYDKIKSSNQIQIRPSTSGGQREVPITNDNNENNNITKARPSTAVGSRNNIHKNKIEETRGPINLSNALKQLIDPATSDKTKIKSQSLFAITEGAFRESNENSIKFSDEM